jgi:hypothetical protein
MQEHHRSVMDRVRGVWTIQDPRPEKRNKASESAMAVMN